MKFFGHAHLNLKFNGHLLLLMVLYETVQCDKIHKAILGKYYFEKKIMMCMYMQLP